MGIAVEAHAEAAVDSAGRLAETPNVARVVEVRNATVVRDQAARSVRLAKVSHPLTRT